MSQPKHVLIHTSNAWGHLKPLLNIAARIARARPDTEFTVLTSALNYAKVIEEVTRVSPDPQMFHCVDVHGMPGPAEILTSAPGFDVIFSDLWQGRQIECKTSGRIFSGLPRPTMVIVDFFAYPAAAAVRELSGKDCKLVLWLGVLASATLAKAGPKEMGGLGDARPDFEALVASGMDPAAAGVKVWTPPRDPEGVIKSPGIPPMYYYEETPQLGFIPPPDVAFYAQQLILLADATLSPTSSKLESEAIQSLHEWIGPLGISNYLVGPASYTEAEIAQIGKTTFSQRDEEVIAFLDGVHKSHGDSSVVYISFGSLFWPHDPERLWAVIDELLGAGIPFVFAQASPFAVVPPHMAAAVDASPISLAVPWVPQERVLAHPSVGWFITHGGWNSVQEALLAKVPLIFWPIGAEQPGNAAMFSVGMEASYELLSVRTGVGAQAPYRCVDGKHPMPEFSAKGARKEMRELIASFKNDDGQRIRSNFESLGEDYGTNWSRGGEAQVSMEQFLKDHHD